MSQAEVKFKEGMQHMRDAEKLYVCVREREGGRRENNGE